MPFVGQSWAIRDQALYEESIEGLRRSIVVPENLLATDNMILWNRNFSFRSDRKLMDLVVRHHDSLTEISIVYRTYVLCFLARLALRHPGDFVEIGAYKGYTANVIADRVDLGATGKNYWLYDVFDHAGTDLKRAMAQTGPELEEKVRARFADYPYVRVIQGLVPDSFEKGFPERIAFAHIDLNQAPAEIAALRWVMPRLVPGGILVLDDYGCAAYQDQKTAEDEFLAGFGLEVLELPTGQGIVFKP